MSWVVWPVSPDLGGAKTILPSEDLAIIPGATEEQISWFNDLCRKTTSPENAARLLVSRADIDITALLEKVQTPTLILHSRDDDVTPLSEGRLLAAAIPNAEFIELDSKNHVLLETEPASERVCNEVLEFVGLSDS